MTALNFFKLFPAKRDPAHSQNQIRTTTQTEHSETSGYGKMNAWKWQRENTPGLQTIRQNNEGTQNVKLEDLFAVFILFVLIVDVLAGVNIPEGICWARLPNLPSLTALRALSALLARLGNCRKNSRGVNHSQKPVPLRCYGRGILFLHAQERKPKSRQPCFLVRRWRVYRLLQGSAPSPELVSCDIRQGGKPA